MHGLQTHSQGLRRRQEYIFQYPVLYNNCFFSESIIQKAKSKLVLDHVIVQKMDDDDEAGGDFQSILTHGAKNLFADDHEARDIICES